MADRQAGEEGGRSGMALQTNHKIWVFNPQVLGTPG